MLLAYAVDDRSDFDRIWDWTRANLQLPDGLFAYHWAAGQVLDTDPAADADVQIAWALDLAGERWSVAADTTAAQRIAQAIAAVEIGYDDQGEPTLAAGPWAITTGRPTEVEPGYWTFPAYAALARLTGDHRWQDLTTADARHLSDLSGNGTQLVPDWATLGDGQPPSASPAPQTNAPAVAGQDGLRAPIWAACQPPTQALDSHWWQLIGPTAREGPLTRNLDGRPADTDASPLSLVAAAAAATAAGREASASRLLGDADRVATEHSTYYGDAWNALGHVLLTTSLIPGCTP